MHLETIVYGWNQKIQLTDYRNSESNFQQLINTEVWRHRNQIGLETRVVYAVNDVDLDLRNLFSRS